MAPEKASEIINRVLNGGNRRLSADESAELRDVSEAYPYFCLPAQLLLERGAGLDPDERIRLQTRIALSAGSPTAIANAVSEGEWSGFYPPPAAPAAPDTDNAIDTFLKTYGTVSAEEESMLERLIFNPTPDYAEMLAREEQANLPSDNGDEASPDSQESRINAFILNRHPASPKQRPAISDEAETPQIEKTPIATPEHTDDSLLSESLAKIFIKQRRYDRAYEIISGLNLKYPKKSVYFADQLRFLRKLILNQRHLSAREQQNDAE